MNRVEAPALSMLPPPQSEETLRYSKEEWEAHRPVIVGMYPLKGMRLQDIAAFLKEDRGFIVNERQLKRKIKDWKLEKNVRGDEREAIVRKLQQRTAVGKKTTVRVKGQPIEPAKILRWQKKNITLTSNAVSEPFAYSPAPPTPSDISCNTPQDMTSPSPFQPFFDPVDHITSGIEVNGPPPSLPTPHQSSSGLPSWRDGFSTDIGRIVVDDVDKFDGQSPQPFTAPPSPMPAPKPTLQTYQNIQGATGDLLPVVPWHNQSLSPNTMNSARISNQTRKTRYREKDELELTQRLNDLELKLGSHHPAALDTALRLARVYIDQCRYRSAGALYKRSAEILQNTVGEFDSRTLLAYSELSYAFQLQGQDSQAERLSRLAYSRASQTLPLLSRDLLRIKLRLATQLNDLMESERMLREVLVSGGASLQPNDRVILTSMVHLARLLVDRGEFSESEKIYLAILETTVLDQDLESQLKARSHIADIYRRRREYARAEEMFKDVQLQQKRLFGPEHADTLSTQLRLMLVLRDSGRFAVCDDLLQDTLTRSTRVLGKRHPVVCNCAILMVEFLNEKQSFEEAEAIAKNVLEISSDNSNIRLSCYALVVLSKSYHGQGRLEEASATIQRAFEEFTQLLGADHPDTKSCKEHISKQFGNEPSMPTGPQPGYPNHASATGNFGLSSSHLDPLFPGFVESFRI